MNNEDVSLQDKAASDSIFFSFFFQNPVLSWDETQLEETPLPFEDVVQFEENSDNKIYQREKVTKTKFKKQEKVVENVFAKKKEIVVELKYFHQLSTIEPGWVDFELVTDKKGQ